MTIEHVTEEVNDNNHPPAKNVPEKKIHKTHQVTEHKRGTWHSLSLMVDRRIVLVKVIIVVVMIIANIIFIVITTRLGLVCTTPPARPQSASMQDLSLSRSDPLMSPQVIVKIIIITCITIKCIMVIILL